jgi:hypothetical protein
VVDLWRVFMRRRRRVRVVDGQPGSNSQVLVDAVVSMGRRNTQLEPILYRKQKLKSLAR